MELLIFETNITSKKKLQSLGPVFNNHSDILKWSVDLEDIDKVLRIEATPNLSEEKVMDLIRIHGFYIKPLPD